jgi:hypothetical protein
LIVRPVTIKPPSREAEVEARGPGQAEFDQQMFEKELRTLREVIERGGRKPPQDLSYTIFVLAVLWLAVGVPFFTGAVLAFAINR